ncbi:MAG: hypothetical protein R3C61_14050 [Bacteroidia bacterium]
MAVALLLTCFSLNLYLTGISWFLQIIHFPLFERVGPNQFHDYHRTFSQRKQFLILIPSLAAIACAAILLWIQPWGTNMLLIKANFGLTALAMGASIVLVQPLHKILASHGYSDKAIRQLTRVNWVRTAAWTAGSLMIILTVFNIIIRHTG